MSSLSMRPHGLLEPSTDSWTRYLHKLIPIAWQENFRDSGLLRAIADGSVGLIGLPLSITRPELLFRHIFHSIKARIIKYGEDKSEFIETFQISNQVDSNPRILVFVHGGAWGSGKPWMYRLSALSAGLLLGCDVVYNIGYKVYPDSNIRHQVSSVIRALRFIRVDAAATNDSEIVLMGHSSGANIAALAVIELCRTSNPHIAAFVGLSGVYDIGRHYEWEKSRGVHIISPMGASAHQENFELCSPTYLLNQGLLDRKSCSFFPEVYLLHGSEDNTVPLSSSMDFADALRRVDVKVHCSFPYVSFLLHFVFYFYYYYSFLCFRNL